MKQIINTAQVAFAAVGGCIGWFLGGFDGFLYALIAFVAVDFTTGIMCGVVSKTLSSEICFRGIFKKVLIFALVGVGHMLDAYILGQGDVLRTAVIFFYIANEGISILENASLLGLPVPAKLKDILKKLNEGDDNNNETV